MNPNVPPNREGNLGHAEHSQRDDRQQGLPGSVERPIVITFLGAGSGFCPTLCRDVLLIPGASRGEFRLCDIDLDRLGTMHEVITNLITAAGREGGWTVRSDPDRRKLLPGTTYAICCVEVSGTACVAWDNDIPLKYGIDQCIGDTLGPGGLFKGLRTIPVFLDILRDMRELCPRAILLNYTNPMSMLVCAAGRAVPEIELTGLCHSVQKTGRLLAQYAGVPYEQLEWACAGINHLAWFTTLRHRGEDLYAGRLLAQFRAEVESGRREAERGLAIHDAAMARKAVADDQPYDFTDLIRKDMCVHFGAFITESSGHLSEYLPYYRKSDAGRALLRRGYDGGSRFYATNWPTWRANADAQRLRLLRGEEKIPLERSWEYASWIIEAREKDAAYRFHGNVMNHPHLPGHAGAGEAGKLIANLPGDGAVEVACTVDRAGLHPTRYGRLPPQMAHICASNMAYFDLAAQACIEKSKEAAIHALLLDPLTAALLTPGEIRAMTLDMFDAEADFLPGYR